MSQNLLSAAVVIGSLRVNFDELIHSLSSENGPFRTAKVIKISQNYDKMSGIITFDLGNEVAKATGVSKDMKDDYIT